MRSDPVGIQHALTPPPAFTLQEAPFDPGAELTAFLARTPAGGAVVNFLGLVRSDAADPLVSLTLDCYPDLARAQLAALTAAARQRFDLLDLHLIHRFGTLLPDAPIVLVLTRAAHRAAAFAAAEFLMDYLKTDAPFWKKEVTASGSRWVAAKAADDQAKARWI